jgi:hypothetical protein
MVELEGDDRRIEPVRSMAQRRSSARHNAPDHGVLASITAVSPGPDMAAPAEATCGRR